MWKAALLAIGFVGASVSGALALDLVVKSSLSQTLAIDSNYQMLTRPVGETYLPVQTLVVDAVARTPTMRFSATVDLSYRSYFGPGAVNLVPGLDRGLVARVEKTTSLTTYKLAAARRYAQASAVQLAETGVSTIGGDVITTWVEGAISHRLSDRDLLTWVTRASSLEFTSPTGTPSVDVLTTGVWRHTVNPLTVVIPLVQFESITYGDTANTEVMIWRGMMGAESRLTPRLFFKGNIGVVHASLTQDGSPTASNPAQLSPTAFNPAQLPSGGAAASWVGDMVLTYNLTKRNDLSFAAARSVGPDSLGQILASENVGVVLSHRLNYSSTLNFSAQWSRQNAVDSVSNLYSASVAYGLRFAPEWYMDVAYRFRHRTGTDGDATSNAVFFTVRRDTTLLAGGTDRGAPIPVVVDPIRLMASPGEWAVIRRLLPDRP